MKNKFLSQSEKPAGTQTPMQIGPSRQIAMAASSMRDESVIRTYSFKLIAERSGAATQTTRDEIQVPHYDCWVHGGLNE